MAELELSPIFNKQKEIVYTHSLHPTELQQLMWGPLRQSRVGVHLLSLRELWYGDSKVKITNLYLYNYFFS